MQSMRRSSDETNEQLTADYRHFLQATEALGLHTGRKHLSHGLISTKTCRVINMPVALARSCQLEKALRMNNKRWQLRQK